MGRSDQDVIEHVQTLKAASEALGVSERAAKRYVQELMLEKEPAGWPLDLLREHHEGKLYNRGKDRSPASERLLLARIAERRAKGDLARVERLVEEGRLVSREAQKERDLSRIRAVRGRLLEWERRLGPVLVGLRPAEARVILERERETVLGVWRRMTHEPIE